MNPLTMKADTILSAVALLSLALVTAPAARAQGERFSFDASGNPTARSSAAAGPPQILRQPVAQIVEPGHSAAFSVTLADARDVTFQWKVNGTNINGATGDTLRLNNVAPANEASYTVSVSNASGSLMSDAASLWIDSDGDRLPDTWEIACFGNLAQNALGDFDVDGVSNLDEFLQGTDPANNASLRVRLGVTIIGGGTIIVSPRQDTYAVGDTVTLTAVPTAPYSFDRWSGDLGGTAGSTPLTLTTNKNVTALFSYLAAPPGLIAWWRGETDASDLVAGHHGTFYAGASVVGPAVTPSGLVGGAFNFDGTVHVRVPDAADLRPDLFSAETWVFPTAQNAAQQTVLARGSSTGTTEAWSLSVVNGRARFTSAHLGSGANAFDSQAAVPLNQWTHLAVTFDGYYKRLYVNGALDGASGYLGPLIYDPATAPVTIGSDWDAGASANRFTGRIDEVSLYGRALSDAEIAAVTAIGRIGKTVAQPYFTTSARLPDAVAGDAYSDGVAAVIGTAPFSFSLAAGSLPPGLSLGESGALNGVPAAPGDYAFTVAARDAAGRLNQQTYSLSVGQRIAPPLGMLGWWRAEPDSSGLAKDQVAGHDGTFYRNGVTVSGTDDVAGKIGRAFTFDGALHIRVPDAASLRPAQVTGEAWVYPIVYSGFQSVLAKGSSTGSEDTWWLGMVNGYAQFYSSHENNAFNSLTGPAQLPLNQWTHLAFTFDGSATVLYVNGVAVNRQIGLGPLVYSPSVPLTIGADWSAGSPSDVCYGRVDEATLYGRALSAREIAAIAAAGAGGKALTGPFSVDLGRAVTNQSFSGSFSFPMGAAPITYSLVSGTLPPGFILGSNGALSGATATRGDFTFTVRATDANGAWQDQIGSLRVYLPANRPPGLISWYRAENNALDAIGANPGALAGAAGYGAGKVGTAFTLNGSPDLVQIPDSPSLRPAAISAEAWVSVDSQDRINAILGKTVGTGQSNSWALYTYSGLHAFIATANGATDIYAPWSPQRGRWYHLALAYDGAQLRLYIDGARVAAGAATGALAYDSHPVIFGADIESESVSYNFKGKIDEAAIYGRGLSDAEIASIYAADLAGKALPGFGDNEDRDGDGLANVLEYGLGADPARFSLAPAVGIVRNADGSVQGKISFLRDPAKTDLTMIVESSGDLMDWTPIATSVNGQPFTGLATVLGEVAGAAPRIVTVVDPYTDAAGQGKGFLRVRVSR